MRSEAPNIDSGVANVIEQQEEKRVEVNYEVVGIPSDLESRRDEYQWELKPAAYLNADQKGGVVFNVQNINGVTTMEVKRSSGETATIQLSPDQAKKMERFSGRQDLGEVSIKLHDHWDKKKNDAGNEGRSGYVMKVKIGEAGAIEDKAKIELDPAQKEILFGIGDKITKQRYFIPHKNKNSDDEYIIELDIYPDGSRLAEVEATPASGKRFEVPKESGGLMFGSVVSENEAKKRLFAKIAKLKENV